MIIGVAVFAAAAAIVLAIALGSGDDEKRAEQAPHGPPTTGVTETTSTAPATETVEDLTDTAPRPNARRAEVEKAVLRLVADAESGRPTPGVDPTLLPTSDELSIERTRIGRGGATVWLAGGVVVRLGRSQGEWTVVNVSRAR